jgi:hypothetical protein
MNATLHPVTAVSLTLRIAIGEVAQTIQQYQPDVLFSASMWTPEEAADIEAIATRERPGIKIHAIPHGLQLEQGPDAIVAYLVRIVPGLLDSIHV